MEKEIEEAVEVSFKLEAETDERERERLVA